MTLKEAYQPQTPKDICRICHAKSITQKVEIDSTIYFYYLFVESNIWYTSIA